MSKPSRRFYVHGDVDEQDELVYYCAICDVFFAAEHFRKSHADENMAAYGRSFDEFQRQKESGKPVKRPENPRSAPF